MAFVSRDLSVLAYANGFTLWHYTTSDAATDLGAAGYFNGASDNLRVGDMILANAGMGSAPAGTVVMVAQSDFNRGVVVAPLVASPAAPRPAENEFPECGSDDIELVSGSTYDTVYECGTCGHGFNEGGAPDANCRCLSCAPIAAARGED